MKIRHPGIDGHLTSDANVDDFASMMVHMVNLYKTCPDASKIRFIQAIEDQFKANAPSRGRSSGGSTSTGSGWRDLQKSQFSGRGAKWIKVTGRFLRHLNEHLDDWSEEGDHVDNYRRWIEKAGYGWIRYTGPRGTEDAQELAFEVRIFGSKLDHPKHLIKFSQLLWDQKEDDRSVLGGTPFSMNLEN